MPADTLIPPPGWEGIAATLEELRANYLELAGFLDRQWRELEALREDLGGQARRLDEREREIERHEEDIAVRLELAEVYKELGEARCELLRERSGNSDDAAETLVAAWTRIEELENEIVSLKKSKPVLHARSGTKLPIR